MSIKKDFIDQLVAFFCMMLLTTYCYTSGGVKRYIMPSFVSVIIVLLLCLFGMVYLNRGKIIIKKTFLLLVFLAILVIISIEMLTLKKKKKKTTFRLLQR